MSINIVIGGEAGQGLVTVGEFLAKSLVRAGYFIVVTQGYQSRIRGGHNTFAIHVAKEELTAPKEEIDLLVALNEETITLHKDEMAKGGFQVPGSKFQVPYEKLGSGKLQNTAALGVAAQILGLDKELVLKTLTEHFGKKDEAVAAANAKVLNDSYLWSAGQNVTFPKLPPADQTHNRVMMNGNAAIAAGAVSSGVKFAAFYPMTPSTTVSLNLLSYSKTHGTIVEQAEDEIAAINMAIGASFVGAPSMTATSGGGFALMVEGVSLAGMTETPVVIVVGQRPGPATGLPTRTEQADLEFVLHAGHGEFPRAIFSPGTVEECFHLTRRAFELAEKYQGPVFILTDQFLADSFRGVEKFDIEGMKPIKVGAAENDIKLPYNRYALTETGVSPRLLPGATKNLVVAGSDEHTEDGHLTEDLAVRKLMVEKRLKKILGLTKEITPPIYTGDERPDKLFVSFGSTFGAVKEAAGILKKDGKKTATLHFPQVWPLEPATFLNRLSSAREVIAVEGNAFGQFARLIRRETGFEIKRRISRYDGLPITPEYILESLRGRKAAAAIS